MVEIKMNFLKYMDRIEDKIGQKFGLTDTNSADRIIAEPWFDVVIREINQISMEVAKEIQQEVRIEIDKGSYNLQLHEAPFTRLLALEIVLSAWLGWILNEKQPDKTKPLSAPECFKRIQSAYDYGQKLSDKYPTKSIKQIMEEESQEIL
jgi:predicted DNA-binding transcriptional regulator